METIKLIRAIWNSQPTSEKIGCIVFAFGFPILMTAIAVILP